MIAGYLCSEQLCCNHCSRCLPTPLLSTSDILFSNTAKLFAVCWLKVIAANVLEFWQNVPNFSGIGFVGGFFGCMSWRTRSSCYDRPRDFERDLLGVHAGKTVRGIHVSTIRATTHRSAEIQGEWNRLARKKCL